MLPAFKIFSTAPRGHPTALQASGHGCLRVEGTAAGALCHPIAIRAMNEFGATAFAVRKLSPIQNIPRNPAKVGGDVDRDAQTAEQS